MSEIGLKKGKVEIVIFGILLFCSFFSINSLPVNPVYVLAFPFVALSLIVIKFSVVNKFQLLLYIYFLLSTVTLIVGSYLFSGISLEAVYLSSILYTYCILLGAQTVAIGLKVGKNGRIKSYNFTYNILIFFMFLDFIIRFVIGGGGASFYDYKWGLFYFDSNFSAIIILLFLMFSIFLKVNEIYDIGKIRYAILVVLLILTFSRAAIFSFIVSYILLRYAKNILLPIISIFSIFLIYKFVEMVEDYISGSSFVDIDGSFNSKFYIISVAIDNYHSVPFLNKMFGIGLANFPYYSNGVFAHNMLVTLVYEFGYLGVFFFIIFLISAYRLIGKNILFILFPFFIAGFSLFSAFMPFFFVLLACMYVEVFSLRKNII